MSENTPEAPAAAEASASTSPIVRVDWVGLRLLPAPASHAKHGLTVRFRARSLTLYRANGDTVTRTPKAGRAEVEQLLRASAEAAVVKVEATEAARLYAEAKAKADAWAEANPKATAEAKAKAPKPLTPAEAVAKAKDRVRASGSITLPVEGRAPRTAEMDTSAKAEAAMLAIIAQAEAEAEAEGEAEGENTPEA